MRSKCGGRGWESTQLISPNELVIQQLYFVVSVKSLNSIEQDTILQVVLLIATCPHNPKCPQPQTVIIVSIHKLY